MAAGPGGERLLARSPQPVDMAHVAVVQRVVGPLLYIQLAVGRPGGEAGPGGEDLAAGVEGAEDQVAGVAAGPGAVHEGGPRRHERAGLTAVVRRSEAGGTRRRREGMAVAVAVRPLVARAALHVEEDRVVAGPRHLGELARGPVVGDGELAGGGERDPERVAEPVGP